MISGSDPDYLQTFSKLTWRGDAPPGFDTFKKRLEDSVCKL